MEQQSNLPQNSTPNIIQKPLSPMRRIIARRMTESKTQVPHFYLTTVINMQKVTALRQQFNIQADQKISYNDFIIKATALALKIYPQVNTSWVDDSIHLHQVINIGVAVGLEDGLVVPVIQSCDQKTLNQIAKASRDLTERAKVRKLKSADIKGGTFTISNLGMYGIHEFSAVINPPEAAILAIGAIETVPVVKDGQIGIGEQMKMTLSCDHRVIDGAVGAAFLKELKGLLENPDKLAGE
ncbi:2-oxo acid dehydrogenase subunit E2 [candidate division KSB1 bacterium]|nr:2-oxo acid dehydrogenase subunit E2 [candidate division KSB1 bacterium]